MAETKKSIEKTILEELNKPLPDGVVKQREGSRGMMLDYLEGWWVKQNANRIFGINNWSYEPIWEEMKHIPLPNYKDKKNKQQKTGLYTIPVLLSVTIGDALPVMRGDIGVTQYYGELSKEMALKGCVTDGLKRCFAAFGEQFGLLLYGKGGTTAPPTKSTGKKVLSTQAELMETFGIDAKQVPPTCPKCVIDLTLVPRKDGTGVFWGCPNWRDGCKTIFNVEDVALDGTVRTANVHPVAADEEAPFPESPEDVGASDMPF